MQRAGNELDKLALFLSAIFVASDKHTDSYFNSQQYASFFFWKEKKK